MRLGPGRAQPPRRAMALAAAPGCVALIVSMLLAFAAPAPRAAGNLQSTPVSAAPDDITLVERYCGACHNSRLRAAGLVLEPAAATASGITADAERWEKVARKLRSGTMPPPGAPRPQPADMAAFIARVESTLDRAAAAHPDPGHVPALHRLNRAEYANAVRDLLALDIDVTTLLPPDDSGYGFDNIADVLSVSPMLMERYLGAANKISRIAVGDTTLQPVTEIFTPHKLFRQDDRVDETLPFGSRGGLAIDYYFPVDGQYTLKLFFLRVNVGPIRGLGEPHQLEVRLNGRLVQQRTIGGDTAGYSRSGEDTIDGMEVTLDATAGPAVIGIAFVKRAAVAEGMLRPLYSITSYEYSGDMSVIPHIQRAELHGPISVRGTGQSPSRQQIFVCRPAGAVSAEPVCARNILARLARRAYRRPVTTADLGPLLALHKATAARRGFDAGIAVALARILVSPEFLFRIERDDPPAAPGGPRRPGARPASVTADGRQPRALTDIELASRLSFFLWSSIPDPALLDLAARNRLHEPVQFEAQVRRLFADDRARALVTNFAGQWLYLRNLRLAAPDPYVFPDFDENLRLALEREVDLFMADQIRGDHRLTDVLTSEQTFLNERLAKHYGIANVYGSHFRRVSVTAPERKGLLGKAGVLTLTSYPHRTSPVLRGKWLLENLLGAPPPPPPPDVPALIEPKDGGRRLTIRQQMEQHRASPACAGCHKSMDPLGLALENFDAVGRYRTVSEGAPIDAATTLLDGTAIDGPVALTQALLQHRDQFVRTVTEKMLAYALGRGIEWRDGPLVRDTVRNAGGEDATWSSLVLAIARSAAFRTRMSAPPSD